MAIAVSFRRFFDDPDEDFVLAFQKASMETLDGVVRRRIMAIEEGLA